MMRFFLFKLHSAVVDGGVVVAVGGACATTHFVSANCKDLAGFYSFNLIQGKVDTLAMDPFDDILPVAPAARGRPGGKFAPKAKAKQPPRKEKSGSEHDAGVSALSVPAEQLMGCENSTLVELPNLEEHVCVKGDTAALVDSIPSTTASSEVELVLNFTNLPKPAFEADPVASEVGPVTNPIPETSLTGSMEELPKKGNGSSLESNKHVELIDNSSQVGLDMGFRSASHNSVAIFESNIQSSFDERREREVVSEKFELDPFSDFLPGSGTKTARKFQPKIKPRPRVGTTKALTSSSSNVMLGMSDELPTSCTNEVQSFKFSADGSGGLNRSTDSPVSSSDIPTTDLSNKFENISSSIPFSEDRSSLAAVIPSQLDSLNVMLSEVSVQNGTKDLPSSIGKSAGENADIFSGLDSLDDLLPQAGTDTGKPALQSFNEKGIEGNFVIPESSSMNSSGVCDTTQVQMFPGSHTTQGSLTVDEAAVLNEDDTHANNRRLETEEVVDLGPGSPINDVLHYQSLQSGADPMNEELTNTADNPTLAELLQADVTGEKQDANNGKKKDGTKLSSPRKHRRSSGAHADDKGVKTSRQLRKQAPLKPVNNSLDDNDGDDFDPLYNPKRDELEESDDEFEVDYSSKKTTSSSIKKPVAKNGKTSQKRKKDSEGVEDTPKEPRKKFSRSTQRRKRYMNKSLLEIPEDEIDMQTLPLKDIILLAEYKERLAKKEATTSSTNQSGVDPFHEDDAYGEEENFGSEDDREPGDDQPSESVPLASSLFNYQSFMDKAPRGKWTKQDTELFYEAVRQFGTDFSMIQLLFPDRTRHQIKLKYKKEERQHPLQLADAVNNRAKDHTHFKLVIERLQKASAKADQDPGREEASDFMTGEEVEDLAPSTNEDVAATEQETVATTEPEANVKDQEESMAIQSPEQSDDSDDDLQKWAQYKSEY